MIRSERDRLEFLVNTPLKHWNLQTRLVGRAWIDRLGLSILTQRSIVVFVLADLRLVWSDSSPFDLNYTFSEPIARHG